MDPVSEPSSPAAGSGAWMFAGAVGAALLGAVSYGDASGVDGILPVGGVSVVLLAGVVVAVSLGRVPAPRIGRFGRVLASFVAVLVAWTAVTMAWSIVPDRSWDSFNKSVAYAAFLGLGLMLAAIAGRVASRLTAAMLALVIAVTLVWALASKAIPALDSGGRVARLSEPIGHWNALALICDVAIVLGLWLGVEAARRRSATVAGGTLVYLATLALMLTLSRAGVVVGIVVLVLWLALSSRRVESGLLLLASTAPAAVVGAWAFTRPALTEDLAARADRVSDGAVFGVLTLCGAGLVAALVGVGAGRALRADGRTALARALVGLAAVCLVVSVGAVAFGAAQAVSRGRDCAEVENDPGRFGSLESARLCWWGEAWDVFVGHAPLGSGAGTFEVARKRYRSDARTVLEPHSVPLQQLADGGVVAFLLFVGLVGSAAGVCVCARRRLEGPERLAAAALLSMPVAYLGHALVDYSWNFLAVTAPTMVVLGVLAGAGGSPGARHRRPILGVGVVVAAIAVLGSFALPHLSDRFERSSTRALVDGDLDRARERADRARTLDRLAAEPLWALARVEQASGRPRAAERRYIQAVELQPDNPEAWYALGMFEFESLRNLCATYRFLNHAYTLDPAGDQWVKGGPLDVARAAVNEGGCATGS